MLHMPMAALWKRGRVMEELFDTLIVVVVGLYGAEVVRKVWRRR